MAVNEQNRASRVYDLSEFVHLNRFYQRPEARQVVYDLYRGECQRCRRTLDLSQFHIAHIVPRSSAALFAELYPGLDVDNLLNLSLSCPPCNLMESDYVLLSPEAFGFRLNRAAHVVHTRLEKIVSQKKDALVHFEALRRDDSRLCEALVVIPPEELTAAMLQWEERALRLPMDLLKQQVRDRLVAPSDVQEMLVSRRHVLVEAAQEGLRLFDEAMLIDESRLIGSFRRDATAPWWERLKDLHHENRQRRGEGQDLNGLYLDSDEAAAKPLVLFLRTPAQRWLLEQFSLVYGVRKLMREQESTCKRHVVLPSWMWPQVHRLAALLQSVASAARVATADPLLQQLPSVASFGVSDGELQMNTDVELPQAVLAVCRELGDDSIWKDGVVLRRKGSERWLCAAHSFLLGWAESLASAELNYYQCPRTGVSAWAPKPPQHHNFDRQHMLLT